MPQLRCLRCIGSGKTTATNLPTDEVSQAEVMAAELASLHVAALVRSPQGIRVIRTGNADNQSGLLFKQLSVAAPKSGDSLGERLGVDGVATTG